MRVNYYEEGEVEDEEDPVQQGREDAYFEFPFPFLCNGLHFNINYLINLIPELNGILIIQ
jgi:hypothetical protein